MKQNLIPFERYAGLNPLFLDFVCRRPDYYPDPPTLEAAVARGRELLGQPALVPAAAFRFRGNEAGRMAQELASGRAVAAVTGHQVGLFTGPLFALLKAFDAIRVAREMTSRGVPAVPVFYALTDDHDLEEIARTARPGPEAPEILVLEGADRSNRRPVGTLPIPEKVREIVDAFRQDAKTPEAREILEAFARRYSPGTSYGEAFVETLLDLVEEPLLVLDPMHEYARSAAAEFFRAAVQRHEEIERALVLVEERLLRDGRPVPVERRPGTFPFFLVEGGERRRVEDVDRALTEIAAGRAWVSTDVLSRPVFKSFLFPAAASILGPAEIAYHAQSLPLFPIFGLRPPVLLPRSHMVLLGPAERRAAQALGLAPQDLLSELPLPQAPSVPEAQRLQEVAREVDGRLAALEDGVKAFDPTLLGALETTRRKVTYQLAQLEEKMRKAAERKDETKEKRRRRLATMVRPEKSASDRLYSPLVPLLAYGREALSTIRAAATGSTEGVVIVDLAATPEESAEAADAR
jgi:bacillithiol biosynthesis cysteine-adding enzyme BshC